MNSVTKFPYGPRIRILQLAGAVMVVSMFYKYLLLHYGTKIFEGMRGARTEVTCYCWACALAL